jgi:hypothetical protein
MQKFLPKRKGKKTLATGEDVKIGGRGEEFSGK